MQLIICIGLKVLVKPKLPRSWVSLAQTVSMPTDHWTGSWPHRPTGSAKGRNTCGCSPHKTTDRIYLQVWRHIDQSISFLKRILPLSSRPPVTRGIQSEERTRPRSNPRRTPATQTAAYRAKNVHAPAATPAALSSRPPVTRGIHSEERTNPRSNPRRTQLTPTSDSRHTERRTYTPPQQPPPHSAHAHQWLAAYRAKNVHAPAATPAALSSRPPVTRGIQSEERTRPRSNPHRTPPVTRGIQSEERTRPRSNPHRTPPVTRGIQSEERTRPRSNPRRTPATQTGSKTPHPVVGCGWCLQMIFIIRYN